MVLGVDQALREKTQIDGIQGTYQYGSVYHTFTIKLSASLEIVVASKINGMTDDFLATLRNAELTASHFPILMITHSPIDTITSGTGDLAANGMPFHAASIIAKIKEDITSSQLSEADQALLELELERKQGDRFSDRSSLYEYSNLLTVLGRGFVEKEDFASFGLLYDDNLAAIPKDKLKDRIQENHAIFDEIDHAVRHANIEDSLDDGEIVILLGVRKAESAARSRSISSREIEGKLLTPHPHIQKAYVYSPLAEIPNENVWAYLLKDNGKSAWNTDNNYLYSLYQGENLSEEDSVVGQVNKDNMKVTGNSRFGCWICTMVKEEMNKLSLQILCRNI